MIEILDDVFEIKHGIIGVCRDVVFQLIELMYFRSDDLIQNLIGMSGECINWLNHPYFPYYRNPKPNLKKQAIQSFSRDVEINTSNIIFKFKGICKEESVFLNILVKDMIFECTIRIELHQDCKYPCVYIGVSTPSQLIKIVKECIGDSDCGARFYLDFFCSQIGCNGKLSRLLKEGGIKDGEVISTIINQVKNKKTENGGRMNFYREGKEIPHIITNIPSEGVHFGFSCYDSSFTLHIKSLRKLCVLPQTINVGVGGCNGVMKCIVYDFNGGFDKHKSKNEEGEEILNVEKYYEEEDQ